ncbi:hypothetical protein N2152v2_000379 [Parachlorella kessleri]
MQAAIDLPGAARPGGTVSNASVQERYVIKYKHEDSPRVVYHSSGASLAAAVHAQSLRDDVEYVEADHLVYAAERADDDPLSANQWHLSKSSVRDAWDTATGSPDVSVCIVDTGIATGHPDLADNYGGGYNTLDNTTVPEDDNGHGTHCAGIVGAVGNNGVGVTGVNWQVGILSCKFLDGSGVGYMSDAARCISWCASQGARVISASFGGDSPSQALRDAISQSGALFVVAAGNDGRSIDVTPTYPAAYDLENILAVAATGQADTLPWWSNYGPTAVDIAAPGAAILSTYIPSTYYTLSGTSMATPVVAGAAALALAAAGGRDAVAPAALRRMLLASVDPIPALAGRVASGGRLNVTRLLSLLPGASPSPSPSPPVGSPGSSPSAPSPSPSPAASGPSPSPGVPRGAPPPQLSPSPREGKSGGYTRRPLERVQGLPPPPPPPPAPPRCAGVAYDGYLHSCEVRLEAATGGTSLRATTVNGTFQTSSQSSSGIVAAYLTPAAAADGQGSPCYDVVTLLPEMLPLAAPTTNCSAPSAVSPLSSLLVYGGGPLTQAALKRQLGIDVGITVGQYDAFKGALEGSGPATIMMSAEVALKSTVLTQAQLLASTADMVAPVARLVFQATAEQLACLDSLATSGPAQSARRLHASPAPFNWTDAALLSDLLQASQAAAEEALVLGQLPASGLSNVSLEHAQAAMGALAALNSLTTASEGNPPSLESLQVVSLLAATTLRASVAQLLAGNLSLAEFRGATSATALQSAARGAVLAGGLPGPAVGPAAAPGPGCSGSCKDRVLPIVLGTVGGGIGVAVVAAGTLFYCHRKREAVRQGKGGLGPTRPPSVIQVNI